MCKSIFYSSISHQNLQQLNDVPLAAFQMIWQPCGHKLKLIKMGQRKGLPIQSNNGLNKNIELGAHQIGYDLNHMGNQDG